MTKINLATDFGDDPLRYATDPAMQVPARVKYWAEVSPQRPFLTDVGGRAVTYGEFYREVRQWCTLLDTLSLEPGDKIASLLPISIDGYALWLAAAISGIWEVSVNRELRGEFLRHPIHNADCRVAFVRPEDRELLAANAVTGVESLVVARDGSLVRELAAADIDTLPDWGDVACVIYTSGSTGPAKGAVIRWAQLASIVGRTPREWLSAEDVVYAPWPMFHITGRSPVISMADIGGQVVFREKFSLHEFWHDIRAYRCTSTTVGAAVPLLLNLPKGDDDRDNPLVHAYGNASGGYNLEFQQRFDVRMMTCYGSTEVGFPIVNRDIIGETLRNAGYLRPGYQIKLVDGEGREVAKGQPGELLIRAPVPEMIMAGYLNMADKTAEVLVDGWYHTGDLVFINDDNGIAFVDRMKDTIRRNGENISSVALEAELLKLDEIHEVAALGLPSDVSGKEIALVIVHRDGVGADPAELYRSLVPRLPKYMLPSYIRFVAEYPKTPGGKIKKNVLLEQFRMEDCWQSPVADAVKFAR